MANVLRLHQQVHIIAALVEGNSIRATERMTGCHRDTIMRLGRRVGDGCVALHDRWVRKLQPQIIQADEIWTYVGRRQKYVDDDHADRHRAGDCWTFIAMDAHKKLIISHLTGKRTAPNTRAFIADLASRCINRPTLATDGWRCYPPAVQESFGADCDYGQVIKEYEPDHNYDQRRYAPNRVKKIRKERVQGKPQLGELSTSYVERQNLTARMQNRRFTRLTSAYSKNWENHQASVGLYVAWYNFCRVHEALSVTPAMESGLTDHVWSIEDLVRAALELPGAPKPPDRADVPEPEREYSKGMSAGQALRRYGREYRNWKSKLQAPTASLGRPTRVPWLRVVEGGEAA